MFMLGVIPGKKGLTESPCILDRAKTIRKIRAILHGFELRFRVRVVVAYLWTAVGFGYSKINQELGHDLGSHAASAISMDRQGICLDLLLLAGILDQTLGKGGLLPMGHHPAHDKTAEDVNNNIEMEVIPLLWPFQLGDIPRPDLIGGSG